MSMRGPLRRLVMAISIPWALPTWRHSCFDGTAYGPALDSGTGGVVEPIITFNGSDVQVVGQLGGEGTTQPQSHRNLSGRPARKLHLLCRRHPVGTSGRPGHLTDAAFFQAYGYGNGLADYDPTIGGGGPITGGPGSYEIIDGQPTTSPKRRAGRQRHYQRRRGSALRH